jgi:ribonuclease P protein component
VVCKRANELSTSRFGFSVSKRVGKATARNRVKRRMREAVRMQGDLVVPGWDVVFIARPRIGMASYGDIESSVTLLLGRAGLLAPVEPTPCNQTE